jgi:hypothetical protein
VAAAATGKKLIFVRLVTIMSAMESNSFDVLSELVRLASAHGCQITIYPAATGVLADTVVPGVYTDRAFGAPAHYTSAGSDAADDVASELPIMSPSTHTQKRKRNTLDGSAGDATGANSATSANSADSACIWHSENDVAKTAKRRRCRKFTKEERALLDAELERDSEMWSQRTQHFAVMLGRSDDSIRSYARRWRQNYRCGNE